jgi:hypothetical protein
MVSWAGSQMDRLLHREQLHMPHDLQNADCLVLVLCPEPSKYPNIGILNRDFKGNKDGVEFEYTCDTTVRGMDFIQQNYEVLEFLLQMNNGSCK